MFISQPRAPKLVDRVSGNNELENIDIRTSENLIFAESVSKLVAQPKRKTNSSVHSNGVLAKLSCGKKAGALVNSRGQASSFEGVGLYI